MRFAAAGEVESVGHDVAVLAFPVPLPVETMSSFDSFPVDFQGDVLAPPLLELALAFGVGGAAASEASLGLAVVLEEVLAGPVSVGALFAGEVDWPVGSEALLAAWGTRPV